MNTTQIINTDARPKERLVDALITLLAEKPLSSITVIELTKVANVSRMTFYRNYSSIEHIMVEHLDEIISKYKEEDESYIFSNNMYDERYIRHYLIFMKQNKTFIKSMFEAGMGEMILTAITRYELEKWQKDITDVHLTCKIYFFSGALFNLCVYWVNHDFCMNENELTYIIGECISI